MTSKTPRVSTDSYLLGKDGFGWAGCMPAACGLYNPEQERDACGVGFIVNIKGEKSHSILHDASFILCNMTHRTCFQIIRPFNADLLYHYHA